MYQLFFFILTMVVYCYTICCVRNNILVWGETVRRTKRHSNLFLCLLINILINFEGAIPGIILLVCYFIFHISIWWAISAFVLWILYLLIWMWVLGLVNKSSISDKPKENKNPYSKKGYTPIRKD